MPDFFQIVWVSVNLALAYMAYIFARVLGERPYHPAVNLALFFLCLVVMGVCIIWSFAYMKQEIF